MEVLIEDFQKELSYLIRCKQNSKRDQTHQLSIMPHLQNL